MHGLALNVCNTLEGFSLVVPCGLPGVKMTTIAKESNMPESVTMDAVSKNISKYLHNVFV